MFSASYTPKTVRNDAEMPTHAENRRREWPRSPSGRVGSVRITPYDTCNTTYTLSVTWLSTSKSPGMSALNSNWASTPAATFCSRS